MANFTWTTQYSVKVNELDNQHKKLFDLINQLYDALNQGKGKEIVGPILDGLISYIRSHFSTEEKILSAQHYPEFTQHRQQHDLFVKKVFELQAQYQSGQLAMSANVLSYMRDWLVSHIMKTDQSYTTFLTAKDIH
jgi:hemerythrin-like metal-binding protein